MCHNSAMQRKIDTYLLLKYFKCETNTIEEARIAHWLANDPDGSHAAAYKDARILFEGITLHSGQAAPDAVGRKIPRAVKRTLQWAAAVAALVLAGATGVHLAQTRLHTEYQTFMVPAGKNMQMTLADGSRIWMNGGSEIEVPVSFARSGRNIRLNNGEIFLDVERDEKRPFRVETYAGTIEVLGTKFNVESDEARQLFSTTLIEGSVKIDADNGLQYMMQPNDIVKMEDNVWTVGRIEDTYSVTCWMNGLIDIANTPFDKLLDEFEKTFDVKIVSSLSKMPDVSFTRGKIRISDGVESALGILRLSADFSYEYDRTTNTIYIK